MASTSPIAASTVSSATRFAWMSLRRATFTRARPPSRYRGFLGFRNGEQPLAKGAPDHDRRNAARGERANVAECTHSSARMKRHARPHDGADRLDERKRRSRESPLSAEIDEIERADPGHQRGTGRGERAATGRDRDEFCIAAPRDEKSVLRLDLDDRPVAESRDLA